jgi:hypothetical protein
MKTPTKKKKRSQMIDKNAASKGELPGSESLPALVIDNMESSIEEHVHLYSLLMSMEDESMNEYDVKENRQKKSNKNQ